MKDLDKQASALAADIAANIAYLQSAEGQQDPHEMLLLDKQIEAQTAASKWLAARLNHRREREARDQAVAAEAVVHAPAPADPTQPLTVVNVPVDPLVPDPNPKATAAGKDGDATGTSSLQSAPVASASRTTGSGKKS